MLKTQTVVSFVFVLSELCIVAVLFSPVTDKKSLVAAVKRLIASSSEAKAFELLLKYCADTPYVLNTTHSL